MERVIFVADTYKVINSESLNLESVSIVEVFSAACIQLYWCPHLELLFLSVRQGLIGVEIVDLIYDKLPVAWVQRGCETESEVETLILGYQGLLEIQIS